MTDNISEGRIHYGFFRFNINGTYKFVYIAWCGENVIGMQKGLFNSHSTFMSKFLHGFHVQINARNEEDLDEAAILSKLKVASGSHGRKNVKAQEQSVESTPQTSSSDAGTATGHTRAVDKTQSEQYWQQQRKQEEADKAQREQQNAAALPRAQVQGGASAQRAKFENPQAQQQPPPARAPINTGASRAPPPQQQQKSAPPPAQKAPPPVRSAPPPAAAPPPARSAPPPAAAPPPAYEEPAYEEPAYEEPAYEEPAYQPEPAYEEPAYEEPAYQPEPAYEEPAYGGGGGGGGGGAGFQCRALYDYTPENAGDLSFQEGDYITVTDDQDPSGWWSGEVNGVQGFFPSNFVEGV